MNFQEAQRNKAYPKRRGCQAPVRFGWAMLVVTPLRVA